MSAWDSPAHVEWQVLRGEVPDASCASAAQVVHGDFSAILRSATSRPLVAQMAERLQVLLAAPDAQHGATTAALKAHTLTLDGAALWETMCVAIASLHAFVQLNWTGPDFTLTPASLLRTCAPQHVPPRDPSSDADETAYARALHTACLDVLTLHGEPAYHLCDGSFYLVFALAVFRALAAHADHASLVTLPWWHHRAAEVHRRVLDEAVAFDAETTSQLEALASACRARSAAHESTRTAWDTLAATAVLETALAYQRAGFDREASEQLVDAAKINGLEYELTGALGKRTKFQKEDKTQLVLLAESREPGAGRSEETAGTAPPPNAAHESTGWQATVDPDTQVENQPATYVLNDDTLLEQTKFTATTGEGKLGKLAHLRPGEQPPLAVVDQCTMLALCLNIQNTQPAHGLTSEQMGAFVQRVISHPLNWSVHTMSLLLRSRLEANRTRTVERATLQLQALIDQMPTTDSGLRERLRFFHALHLPARWEMQAELARRYVSLGVLRSALEIFERVELWEEVVQCLGLLGRHADATELLHELLSGRKLEADVQLQQKRMASHASTLQPARFARAREAKLWCLLGDLAPDKAEAHYTRAWDVSDASSARAARSLGGMYFALQEYTKAVHWLRRAVRINTLFTRSWFMLGCSYMLLEQWVEAAAAFRKCTALEEEDGESWNNLASCYLRMHQSQVRRLDRVFDEDSDAESVESTSTARDSGTDVPEDAGVLESAPESAYALRMLAHKALALALKHTFDSWRVWANYMMVSVDIGRLSEAARAMARVVEIRSREASSSLAEHSAEEIVDLAVLQRLVGAVTRAPANEADAVADDAPKDGRVVHNPDEGHGLRPAVERLFEQTLLPRFSTHAAVLQIYARFLFWQGKYRAMLDARIKSFRYGLGSADATAVITDVATFRLAQEELDELLDAIENTGARPAAPGSTEEAMPDWRFQARTLLRNFLARTRDSFDDTDEYEALQQRLATFRSV